MLVRFIASLIKLAAASLAIGTLLSFFDISTAQLLARIGLTPEEFVALLAGGLWWAMPKMLLGAVFVIPTWFILNLMRPPSGYE